MQMQDIEAKINYTFIKPSLLSNALVHRSYLTDRERDLTINEHNERLEFLGDAVLELVITDYLYSQFPSEDEGLMTSLRAALVNYKTMGEIGNELGLDNAVLISSGERAELGKARLSIVADAVEALIGAIYLDGGEDGYKQARTFIHTFVVPKLGQVLSNNTYKDPKTSLQEYTQKKFKLTPRYYLVDSEGKDHNKTFYIEVRLADQPIGKGEGKSKQDAESMAAEEAIVYLQNNNLSL
jgi:ribonuclease III